MHDDDDDDDDDDDRSFALFSSMPKLLPIKNKLQ
jgi:hypothetical protein